MIKILIVDDHVLFRQGLNLLLQAKPGISAIGEASSGPEAARMASELQPDLVLLDIAMPGGDGLSSLPRIREAAPAAKIIALSTFDDRTTVVDMLAAGAQGFVLKASAFAELDAAIECVMAGHRFLSPSINDVILDSYVIGKGEFLSQDPLSLLSERERAVLRLICKERPPKAIAAELGISRKTVDIHKKNIMAKLGVSSDLGLYKVCMGLGLIPSPGGASAPR